MSHHPDQRLPTEAEVDALVGTAPFDGECTVLCNTLMRDTEELQGATGLARLRLQAAIRAIRARMKELKCGACLPQ